MRFPNIKMPSIATLIASAVVTVLVALNAQVFHLGTPWSTALPAVLVVAGVYGISVLSHGAFRALIKVPPAVAGLIGLVLAAGQLIVHQAGLGLTVRTVLECVIVAAASLGFEPEGWPGVGLRRLGHGHGPSEEVVVSSKRRV